MRLISLIFVLLAAVPSANLIAQGPVAREILLLESARRDALLSGNATALAAILADDFVEVAANGRSRTKQQNVEDLRSRVLRWTALSARNESVHVFDSTAVVVTGEQEGGGTYNGEAFTRRVRYLRVYLKRDGCWQNVAAQATPASP